ARRQGRDPHRQGGPAVRGELGDHRRSQARRAGGGRGTAEGSPWRKGPAEALRHRRQAVGAGARITRGSPPMSRFFINRPIVAMVIAILMTLVGIVSMLSLPISLYPNIAPPEIQLAATYPGADALTCEQAVSAPIEQQMSGVNQMIYMYSTNASNGACTLRVDFDVTSNAYIDQVLSFMRYSQAEAQLPQQVRQLGITILQSTTSPLALFSLYSPKGTYDAKWLSNYGYINLNDPMTRVPGVGQVTIFGAGQYALRFWVRPDAL